MGFNPLQEKGIPYDKQVKNWDELNVEPYHKDEVQPYTRTRDGLRCGSLAHGGGFAPRGICVGPASEWLRALLGAGRARSAAAPGYGRPVYGRARAWICLLLGDILLTFPRRIGRIPDIGGGCGEEIPFGLPSSSYRRTASLYTT
jgi:hypothetical protein